MVQAQVEPDEGAPVVGDEVDTVEVQRVQERDHVARHRGRVVSGVRRVGLPRAPQVRCDQVRAVGERRHHRRPFAGALRKSVEQQDRRT